MCPELHNLQVPVFRILQNALMKRRNVTGWVQGSCTLETLHRMLVQVWPYVCYVCSEFSSLHSLICHSTLETQKCHLQWDNVFIRSRSQRSFSKKSWRTWEMREKMSSRVNLAGSRTTHPIPLAKWCAFWNSPDSPELSYLSPMSMSSPFTKQGLEIHYEYLWLVNGRDVSKLSAIMTRKFPKHHGLPGHFKRSSEKRWKVRSYDAFLLKCSICNHCLHELHVSLQGVEAGAQQTSEAWW